LNSSFDVVVEVVAWPVAWQVGGQVVTPVVLDQEQVDLVRKPLDERHQFCDTLVTKLPKNKE